MANSPPDYDNVCDALARINATADAAESHGILCGMMCARGEVQPEAWLDYLVDEDVDSGNTLVHQAQRLLNDLYTRTVEQITGGHFDLNLLLPDDNEDIAERVENLSLWCQGFLVGLSVGGVEDIAHLPTESQEIALDLVDISQAGMDSDEEQEPNEAAYAEVVEYVRMGVLVMFAEMNPPREVPPDARIH